MIDTLHFIDGEGSEALAMILDEVRQDNYGFKKIDFQPGDVVVDVGGHIGVPAIYLGKRFPFLKICSYEPHPDNHKRFLANMKSNGVHNIILDNKAVSRSTGEIENIAMIPSNSGGATCWAHQWPNGVKVETISLDDVFEQHKIEQCKLLKVDCEGNEYRILYNFNHFDRVEYLAIEIHINLVLSASGYSIRHLWDFLKERIAPGKLTACLAHMDE